jgi:hypothetical protein
MRRRCENFQQIDVRYVDFRRGTAWQYPPPNGIALSVVGNAVHVIDGAADFFIAIERTACNYGGSRAWFLCPRCGDRRAVLYDSGDNVFGCRRCMRLIHTSATECELDRRLRKMNKAAARLAEYNAKQKWQRWATFERIYSQRVKAERDVVMCSIRRLK